MHNPSGVLDRSQNALLRALDTASFAKIEPVERVALPQGQILAKPGQQIDHLYFMESGMISLVHPLSDGQSIEVGVVGKEGVLGAPFPLGVLQWEIEAMVQMPGTALRVPAAALGRNASKHEELQRILLRYVHYLVTQISRSAACNARHSIDERLARWLLTAHDRAEGDVLPLRHEFLSMMLGIRRAGVTVALGAFKQAGLIAAERAKITVLNRQGLEGASCECYRPLKDDFRAMGLSSGG